MAFPAISLYPSLLSFFLLFPFLSFAGKRPPQFQLGDKGRCSPPGSGAAANAFLAYLKPMIKGVWWLSMSFFLLNKSWKLKL